MRCHFLLQGIFPTQGPNLYVLCILHWQAGSFPLGHLRSPTIHRIYHFYGFVFLRQLLDQSVSRFLEFHFNFLSQKTFPLLLFWVPFSFLFSLTVQHSLWDLTFPDQGSNPGPWQGNSAVLTTGPPGNFQLVHFFNKHMLRTYFVPNAMLVWVETSAIPHRGVKSNARKTTSAIDLAPSIH